MARKKKPPMAHSRKHQGRHKQRRPLPGWLWLLTGLLVGLFAAFLVYLNEHVPADKARQERAALMETPKSADTREVRKPRPAPLPPPPKTPYTFYSILPEMEVAVPEEELEPAPGSRAAPTIAPGRYMLQVGSFRSFPEADRLKASLALLGIEASIQTVTINQKDTWHRVRVGPFDDVDTLQKIRARLKDNDIRAMVLKIRS